MKVNLLIYRRRGGRLFYYVGYHPEAVDGLNEAIAKCLAMKVGNLSVVRNTEMTAPFFRTKKAKKICGVWLAEVGR